MKVTDLRFGNYLMSTLTKEVIIVGWLAMKHVADGNYQSVYDPKTTVYEPIILNEGWLIKLGANKIESFTVVPTYILQLGRFRRLSICVQRCSQMIFIQEYSDKDYKVTTDLICVYNYDYDGELYVHKLQNIFHVFTGQELTIKETE